MNRAGERGEGAIRFTRKLTPAAHCGPATIRDIEHRGNARLCAPLVILAISEADCVTLPRAQHVDVQALCFCGTTSSQSVRFPPPPRPRTRALSRARARWKKRKININAASRVHFTIPCHHVASFAAGGPRTKTSIKSEGNEKNGCKRRARDRRAYTSTSF